jgi:lipopolysaccharide heptosyltransferase II
LRILLVRLREIGDVVFTTPAIRGLRRHFPDASLTYLVEPHAFPVVARNPHLDRVVAVQRGLVNDVRLGRQLRRERFDLAIDFHGGPRASLLTWLSGARERVGYDVAGRGWMYTRRVARPRALRARHSVLNQWDLLEAIGVAAPDRRADAVEMALDPAIAADVDARLSALNVGPTDRLVVIHVSAGNPFRRWPIESFATVAAELAMAPEQRVILTSGPSEADAVARVVAAARARLDARAATRVLAAGEFSLAELRALVDRAALYIGGDSGPLHIAATTPAPIVGLFGPTLPERSAPWRDPACPTESVEAGALPCRPCEQRVCEPGDFRCLTRIRPEQVLEAAKRLILIP